MSQYQFFYKACITCFLPKIESTFEFMYTLGLIKIERPDVLINPVGCSTPEEVYNWLNKFINPIDFTLDMPITPEAVEQVVNTNKLGRINLNGYRVALLFGRDKVIQEATTRYIHLMPRSNDSMDVNKIDNMVIPD